LESQIEDSDPPFAKDIGVKYGKLYVDLLILFESGVVSYGKTNGLVTVDRSKTQFYGVPEAEATKVLCDGKPFAASCSY